MGGKKHQEGEPISQHTFEVELATGVFVGIFKGSTTIEDLSEGLYACFELSSPECTRAIWDVRLLQVSFSMVEAYGLIQHVQGLNISLGRLAFVANRSGFLAALIKQARTQPGPWRTEWKIVNTMNEAHDWLNGGGITLDHPQDST